MPLFICTIIIKHNKLDYAIIIEEYMECLNNHDIILILGTKIRYNNIV